MSTYMPKAAEVERGKYKGIGQWRNSGKGRFTFEIID